MRNIAVGVASRSLFDAIERQALSPRASLRRDNKLLRYLIRMSTLPTPYGLFAGVALGDWGLRRICPLLIPMAHLQVGLDMGWLMPLVWRLEASPQVRCHLRVFANSAAYFRTGQVFLHERGTADASDEMHEVSLRATRVVKHTLEVARHSIAYTDLTAPLLASIPGATEEKVEALLTLLWQRLTDLRPPLTGEAHPASYLQRRLAALPPTTALAEQLAAILKLLFDTLYEKHWTRRRISSAQARAVQ
ncbi:lantibiotic dehydratase [Ktedonobacter racemifer]|uniref:lantibiotic dehydratase n=1 Tax=Ktedonobacter racemifer TaxID=363277 RepID=UPI000A06D16B